ncbi:MAG: DUF2283 domain-containing protein [Dehalococcoidia bacterium]|nr:DUF2283 domain-containing protein [Dehalococcoidia bacterium]
MRVSYDQEVDALRITTGTPEAISESLWDTEHHDIVVDLAAEGSCEIVGLDVMWASVYLPLGKKGYDPESDTLLMGRATSEPELITKNGDIVGYWQMDVDNPDGIPNPIGVAIKRASVHLAKASEKMSVHLVNAD